VVAGASEEALGKGIDLPWLLAGLKENPPGVPLVLMSYANPLMRYGWDRAGGGTIKERLTGSIMILAEALAEVSFAGVIIPDIPLEESGPFREGFNSKGIALIPLVGPNTTRGRMDEYQKVAQGYVYVVSVLGITGVREGLPPEALATLERAREAFTLPLALGFGLKDPSQLSALPFRPDAVIFGSALIRHLKAGGTAAGFMKPWLGQP